MNLQEDPLRPLVELFVCGADTATRVVAKTKAAQLAAHVDNVRFGVYPRMNSGGDGVLFGWKTKTVVPESVKNVEALHSFETGEHICADVSEWMPNVQSGTRWVREHIENK